jgi:hypothetical protein
VPKAKHLGTGGVPSASELCLIQVSAKQQGTDLICTQKHNNDYYIFNVTPSIQSNSKYGGLAPTLLQVL